jgi:hypothetical protein
MWYKIPEFSSCIGLLEVGVIGVEPLHRPFQQAAGIEATGSRGAVDVLLGLTGGFVKVGPVSVEEGEVGHYVAIDVVIRTGTWIEPGTAPISSPSRSIQLKREFTVGMYIDFIEEAFYRMN